MPESFGSTTHTSASEVEMHTVRFVHSISEAGRLLPSASRWNSIELDCNLLPKCTTDFDSLPSRFSKSVDFNLVITDKKYFKRFLYVLGFLFVIIPTIVLLIYFLPHKKHHHGFSKNLTLALNQALVFFDAQKSGYFPKNSTVTFRGDSGTQDRIDTGNIHADLVGGFYDSGNNIKLSFPTAYTITLLSWTVLEYNQKYAAIGELDHVKEIIRWGSDYLLKLFIPPNATTDSTILFSQVGSTANVTEGNNDINCWQRPEDMRYTRPVSICGSNASDLAGEITAALSAASLVLKDDEAYSAKLIESAEKLYQVSTKVGLDNNKQGMYTVNDKCGGQARQFYNSTSYKDELAWGATWLFLATGNHTYLGYATSKFSEAEKEELFLEKGIFYWNNKLTANAVLLSRLRFFRDLGNPYEEALGSSTNRTDLLMCSYLYYQNFNKTEGGLILLKPEIGAPLQYAVTASFLSKLYSDYLDLVQRSHNGCGSVVFSPEMLHSFSSEQINYVLGENPMKMSYVVGYGDKYPTHVHHRAASIPWDEKRRSCSEGERWLNTEDANPYDILGAMVAGPDQNDIFLDERDKPWFTEPSISSNAGLVAALVALHDPPTRSSDLNGTKLGIDLTSIFENVRRLVPAT